MSPLLGALEPTELRLYRTENDIVRYAAAEGYIQVADNHAMLLVQEIHEPEALDVEELRAKLIEAENELDSAGEDSERERQGSGISAASRRFCGSLNLAERSRFAGI